MNAARPTRRYVSRADLPQRPNLGPLDSHRCPGCGCPVKDRRKTHPGQAGRQAEQDTPECRRLVVARREYEAALDEVIDRMTHAQWVEERGRLWAVLNQRAWNRGVTLRRSE